MENYVHKIDVTPLMLGLSVCPGTVISLNNEGVNGQQRWIADLHNDVTAYPKPFGPVVCHGFRAL